MKKYIITIGIILIIGGLFTYKDVFGLDTGALSPGTMADDATVGTVAWSNPDNAKVSDNSRAQANIGADDPPFDNAVRIVKGGSIGTTDKSLVGNWPKPTEAYFSHGGASDLWGETWTVTDINDPTFGVAVSAKVSEGGTSHYLKATNFGFSIPVGATIDGILAEIEKLNSGGLGGGIANVDHIRITVYYTEGSSTQIKTQIKNASVIIKGGSVQIK